MHRSDAYIRFRYTACGFSSRCIPFGRRSSRSGWARRRMSSIHSGLSTQRSSQLNDGFRKRCANNSWLPRSAHAPLRWSEMICEKPSTSWWTEVGEIFFFGCHWGVGDHAAEVKGSRNEKQDTYERVCFFNLVEANMGLKGWPYSRLRATSLLGEFVFFLSAKTRVIAGVNFAYRTR